MATIPNFLVGRHVTALSITVQSVAGATGVLSDTAVVANLITSTGALHTNLAHTVELSGDIEYNPRRSTEQINGITRNRAHHVRLQHGGDMTLTEILRRGNDVCRLAACWFEGSSRFCRVVLARGQQKFTVYMKMSSYRESYQKGQNVGVMTLKFIDANTPPTYTTADR